jgi:hypothetical protein
MVDGAVEIVGLIPTGQATIQGQPEAITGRGQKPDPCQAAPPKPGRQRKVASPDDRPWSWKGIQGDRGRIGSVCLSVGLFGAKTPGGGAWVSLDTGLGASVLPFLFLSQQRHGPSEESAKYLRRIAPSRVRSIP